MKQLFEGPIDWVKQETVFENCEKSSPCVEEDGSPYFVFVAYEDKATAIFYGGCERDQITSTLDYMAKYHNECFVIKKRDILGMVDYTMVAKMKDFKIEYRNIADKKSLGIGEKVTITHRHNDYECKVTGLGINYGSVENLEPDWYIELYGSSGGYYWKQSQDGGTIRLGWKSEEK